MGWILDSKKFFGREKRQPLDKKAYNSKLPLENLRGLVLGRGTREKPKAKGF